MIIVTNINIYLGLTENELLLMPGTRSLVFKIEMTC